MFCRALTFLVLAAIALQVACAGGGLTPDEATRLVTQHSATKPTDKVLASAVSQAQGAVEAIAKVDVNGTAYNFKFRRYDKAWQWEFAETVGGQWIAPDVVMEQIHEKVRLEKAKAWAVKHDAAYTKTIEMLNSMCGALPGYGRQLDFQSITAFRRLLSRNLSTMPADAPLRLHVLPLLQDDLPNDAWGRRIELRVNGDARTAYFVSAGPDGESSTDDDLICVAEGRRGLDSEGDLRWNYVKNWSVPEGFESKVKPLLDTANHARAEYTKVIDE